MKLRGWAANIHRAKQREVTLGASGLSFPECKTENAVFSLYIEQWHTREYKEEIQLSMNEEELIELHRKLDWALQGIREHREKEERSARLAESQKKDPQTG